MLKKNNNQRVYQPYQRKIALFWWMQSAKNFLYMCRELSSLFFSVFSLELVAGLTYLFLGENYYHLFITFFLSAFNLRFLLLALVFSLVHTITWFAAMPKAIDLQINGDDLPEKYLIIPSYIIFLSCSAFILWLAMKFFS